MPPKVRKRSKNAAEATRRSLASRDSPEQRPNANQDTLPEDPSGICNICAEKAIDWAVGSCTHAICGDCSHRLRVLYERKTCALCNESLNQVAVVPIRHYRDGMSFENAVAMRDAFQDKQVGMWFTERARQQQLRHVRGYKCSHKACTNRQPQDSIFANSTQLRAHARAEHRAIYCDVCFGGRKLFISELPLYTLDHDRNYSSRLRGHLRKEHPQCKFCGHYYLDDEKLYAHLQEKHETCFICERNGRMDEYYQNFAHLERHYGEEHYVCRRESCRGLVFATQIELHAHEHSRHNDIARGPRSRAFRVDLTQLHGSRDPRSRAPSTSVNVEAERERQAARRRAFLSSNVVFAGALNFDDSADGTTGSNSAPTAPEQPASRGSASTSAMQGAGQVSESAAVEMTRRPDDGKFHPLALPRDGEELQARNTLLVRKMRSLLDPAAYEDFKRSSGQFRMGDISADEYYNSAVDSFGLRAAVRDILPELAALLPTHLLREPLLQTCLKRTDTKPGVGGSSGSQQNTALSLRNRGTLGTGAPDEQFPTLTDAPVPRRVLARSIRFGAPGPEEFPRLARANRTAQPKASTGATTAGSSTFASKNQASSSSSASSHAGATQPAKTTAATVLRQRRPTHRMFGETTAPGLSSRDNGVSRELQSSDFPSLSVGSKNASGEQQGSSAEGPSGDVTMRTGAVWGGAAATAHERAGRKRGPGRGQNRRPASPPKPAMLPPSEFPAIDVSRRPDSTINAFRAQASSSGAGPSWSVRPQGPSGKGRVIDVVEMSKARQQAKSNLPKIGGSGYGFAWDRKKAQRKRKEIKKSVVESNGRKPADHPSDLGNEATVGTRTGIGNTGESNGNGPAGNELNERMQSATLLEKSDVEISSAHDNGYDLDE